jgi:hypothetical protein
VSANGDLVITWEDRRRKRPDAGDGNMAGMILSGKRQLGQEASIDRAARAAFGFSGLWHPRGRHRDPAGHAAWDAWLADQDGWTTPVSALRGGSDLPREDSGKIFKRKLRAPYWEQAGRQIQPGEGSHVADGRARSRRRADDRPGPADRGGEGRD